jgi:hypothetical protein
MLLENGLSMPLDKLALRGRNISSYILISVFSLASGHKVWERPWVFPATNGGDWVRSDLLELFSFHRLFVSVIALSIIYLYNSALLQISSVDSFGIVIRHISPLGGLCNG